MTSDEASQKSDEESDASRDAAIQSGTSPRRSKVSSKLSQGTGSGQNKSRKSRAKANKRTKILHEKLKAEFKCFYNLSIKCSTKYYSTNIVLDRFPEFYSHGREKFDRESLHAERTDSETPGDATMPEEQKLSVSPKEEKKKKKRAMPSIIRKDLMQIIPGHVVYKGEINLKDPGDLSPYAIKMLRRAVFSNRFLNKRIAKHKKIKAAKSNVLAKERDEELERRMETYDLCVQTANKKMFEYFDQIAAKNLVAFVEKRFAYGRSVLATLYASFFGRAYVDVEKVKALKPPNAISLVKWGVARIKHEIIFPASSIAIDFARIMNSATVNISICKTLIRSVCEWMEFLLSSLFEECAEVRWNTCCLLAYFFSQDKLVLMLHQNLSYDIGYEAIQALFQAADQWSNDLKEMYFYCIGYILEGYPAYSLLNSVSRSGSKCKRAVIQEFWPTFLEGAAYFWTPRALLWQPALLYYNLHYLPMIYMQGSHRNCYIKYAILALSIKLNASIEIVTFWPELVSDPNSNEDKDSKMS